MARGMEAVISRTVAAGVVAGLVMMVAGCSTVGPWRIANLPSGGRIVGGGFAINWRAPVKGTVYLVEKMSGKVIATESLDEGELYKFNVDPGSEALAFKTAIGVNLADAELVLYFKPADKKSGKS